MKQFKVPITIFIILGGILFAAILYSNTMNGKAIEKESKIVADTIYVTISDSICNQRSIKIVIKDEWNNNGRNPFFLGDTAKHKQHSIRELELTQDGWVTDKSVDSICYNGQYFYSSHIFRINNDSILVGNYRNKQGGSGYGALYIKGYHVSKSTPHGGCYIVKRCPDDTIHHDLPVGEQQYIYMYDSLYRLIAISKSDDNAVVYSKKFNDVGEWYEIRFKDLVLKRYKP